MRISQAELDATRESAAALLTKAVGPAAADRYAGDCAIWLIEQRRQGCDYETVSAVRAWYQHVTARPTRRAELFNRTEEEHWL